MNDPIANIQRAASSPTGPSGSNQSQADIGTVYLVGAGPGAADLITLRGLRCLRLADAVLYDRLTAAELLDEAPSHARRINVGKAPGRRCMSQDEINRLMIELARQGLTVVRLKGGDPFVFGRGGEEALALHAAGIPCQVAPGVSSAIAVPAAAGIPVTHQHLARSFAVITGHCRAPLQERIREKGDRPQSSALDAYDWSALASIDTLICLMSVRTLPDIAHRLLRAGRDADTPVAIIECGTTPEQRLVSGPLCEIAAIARRVDVKPPATIVIGKVVGLQRALHEASFSPW